MLQFYTYLQYYLSNNLTERYKLTEFAPIVLLRKSLYLIQLLASIPSYIFIKSYIDSMGMPRVCASVLSHLSTTLLCRFQSAELIMWNGYDNPHSSYIHWCHSFNPVIFLHPASLTGPEKGREPLKYFLVLELLGHLLNLKCYSLPSTLSRRMSSFGYRIKHNNNWASGQNTQLWPSFYCFGASRFACRMTKSRNGRTKAHNWQAEQRRHSTWLQERTWRSLIHMWQWYEKNFCFRT